MKEKLTLSIDKETKKRAKRHAKATGNSISEMVEDFLNTVTADDDWAQLVPVFGKYLPWFRL